MQDENVKGCVWNNARDDGLPQTMKGKKVNLEIKLG